MPPGPFRFPLDVEAHAEEARLVRLDPLDRLPHDGRRVALGGWRVGVALVANGEVVVDLELECGRVLSVLCIDYDKFAEWKDIIPFYKNIRKDSVVLWQAA